jgi:hypothetical protein
VSVSEDCLQGYVFPQIPVCFCSRNFHFFFNPASGFHTEICLHHYDHRGSWAGSVMLLVPDAGLF